MGDRNGTGFAPGKHRRRWAIRSPCVRARRGPFRPPGRPDMRRRRRDGAELRGRIVPISDLLALAAATCIAASGMLIAELRGRVGVFRLVRWQMLAAVAMTGAVSLAVGGWRTVAPWQAGLLAASSLSGIILASTTYFAAIYRAGPRLTALLFSLTSPFSLVLGYLVLGETINATQGAGVGLVLAGVVLAVLGGAPAGGAARPVAWTGLALGVITALGQAGGNLLARPAMQAGVEPFTAMAIRDGVAGVAFTALALLPIARLRDVAPKGWPPRLIALAAAFFGTGLGMSLLMAALEGGNVGVVSTLSSMTPVVILPMVWARSGVRPGAEAWAGAALAVAGTALIALG